ncbi:TonB-dependent receptor [Parasphingorhabdus cellanae]|uniref:TonB-dependent receptor n=1 Tax=Parasphingorhabdus cellanae TaxID=2806553 RepID=A0ABX7T2M7_9SPHN|nr:TonB-dependent receptor [Parasphingorhabdus cellanae]QTD55218.1 TonB-dependent receptor [Parasphingorhabdus cellanae]
MMRYLSIAAAVLGVVIAAPAHAESQVEVDIAAGRLDSAIFVLGKQAGISIGLSDPHIGASRVPRIKGRMTSHQALTRLLAGTEAKPQRVHARHWRIVRIPKRLTSERVARKFNPVKSPPQPVINPDIVVTGLLMRHTIQSDAAGNRLTLSLDDVGPSAEVRGTDALLETLPSLSSTQLGPGRNRLFIRGIADSSFNGPNQAVSGQYLGEARLNYNAPDPDLRLIDLSTIEVYQGPQGTRFGAGTLGGVVRLVPNAVQLDELSGKTSIALAATQDGDPSADANATVNIPVIEGVMGVRASVYTGRQGGYVDDRRRELRDVNRMDTMGGRFILRVDPGAGWSIDTMAAVQVIEARDAQYVDGTGDRLERSTLFAQPYNNEFALGQLVVRKTWDDTELTAAINLVDQEISETFDLTLPASEPFYPELPGLFHQRGDMRLFTSEIRLSRSLDNGGNWFFGTSLVNNRYRIRRAIESDFFNASVVGIENETSEATAFGEITWPLSNRLMVNAGGRISHVWTKGTTLETPSLVLSAQEATVKRNQTAFLPAVGVQYRFAESLTGHVRYQEGFRAAGIDISDDQVERFRNDEVAAIEAGLVFSIGGETGFDAGISAAYTKWDDMQADLIRGDIGLPGTLNIGNGRIWTVDASMNWRPLPGLSIEASAIWSDSKLTEPAETIFVGNSESDFADELPEGAVIVESDNLPNVADFSGRLGVSYTNALSDESDFSLSAWVRYTGESRLGIGPILGVKQGDYVDTGLSANLDFGAHSFWLEGSNIFNARGNRFALGSPFILAFGKQITPLRPRTIRIGFDTRF